jgi:hypothetical protein
MTKEFEQILDLGRFVTGNIHFKNELGAIVATYTDFILKNNKETIDKFVQEYEPIDTQQVR